MSERSQTLDFEATLSELEQVVKELDGEIKLDRALALFDRGMKLSSACQEFLKAAQQKVEVLKKNADGTLSLEPLAQGEPDN